MSKAGNFFLSVEKTPYTYGTDASAEGRGFRERIEQISVGAWLAFGRVLEILFLMSLARTILRHEKAEYATALAATALLASYAAPYVLGFNYERHITPFLVLLIVVASITFHGRASMGSNGLLHRGPGP